jgi:gamma-glutamyltranspeptidase/glutathione hydrolase
MAYAPPTSFSQNWQVTKPAARGRRGMVVAQARDAALAGVAILDAGGNAIDAAVGTAFALAAVEPWNSGLGGIGFAVVHRAGERAAEMVDFGPVAPSALDPRHFKLTGRMKQDLFAWPEVVGDANIHGALSCAVPSAVAGYGLMHERWGRLPMREVLAPAVALAQRGLVADWFTTLKVANAAAVLRLYPESARIYLPNGLPPVPPYQGTPAYLQLGRLHETLARLQSAGLHDFYTGAIAESLVADTAALGGVLGTEDLRGSTPTIRPAQALPWQGRTLNLAGGLTAAPTLARVLELLGPMELTGAPDAAWYVAIARAMRTAYAERLDGLGESEPKAAESCTSHLTVCDEAGTMVAMTTTLLSSMGSRVVLPGSGVLMNNGVMWFDPRPNQPNSLAPGKRPLTNMCPVILAEDGRPVLALGASGGRRIMAAVLQNLCFVGAFGMAPEAAAHHPRIDVSDPAVVNADRRLPAEVLAALSESGPTDIVEHSVVPVNFACPNMIQQREDGERVGISDVFSPWSAAIPQTS